MPHDSVDVPRDEDQTDPRRKSRRRFKLGGRRKTDNKKLQRLVELSTSEDSLDWETLKNIDELAWGIKKEDG